MPRAAAKVRRKAGYQPIAERLRVMMENNSDCFLREVCFTEAAPARYAAVPVLSPIPAHELAGIFAKARHADQSNLAMAVSIRYDQIPVQPEFTWFGAVVAELSKLAEGIDSISRCYMIRSMKKYI